MNPAAVKVALAKLKLAEELLRSLDDFATSLLGKTAEAMDLVETANGLLTGRLVLDENNNPVEKE